MKASSPKKRNKTRNKFELRLDKQLEESKVRYEYETERIGYTIHGTYNPDFIIFSPKGKIYVEAKGYFRPEALRKMVAVKKQNPELDIRLVFYGFNKKYCKWAIKNGFPYSIGIIPDEWLQ